MIRILSVAFFAVLISGCQTECKDKFDCEPKAQAGETATCVMNKCVFTPGLDGGTGGGAQAGGGSNMAGGTATNGGGSSAGGSAGGGMVTVGCGNGIKDGSEICDDGNTVAGDGCEANCGAFTDTAKVKGCAGMNAPKPAVGTCSVTTGDASKLITGTVLGDGITYVGGQVLVSAMGTISCVACDCSAMAVGATTISCPDGVVSPGLINAHDHIGYQANPAVGTAERYEHRHDWRVGGSAHDGHTKVGNGGNALPAQMRWAEIRQVMAGTTSIVGAAVYSANSLSGMMRNIDAPAAGQLGAITGPTGANSETFPLNDISGAEITSGCGYAPPIPTQADVSPVSAYLPHIAEGIEESAHNEFVCLSSAGGVGILGPRTGMVHGIGLKAADIALAARSGTSLIWSPRSNISLYGDTASIALYKRLGANIALGTDWTISGSMNLLRELQCADFLNKTRFNNTLTDEEMFKIVTSNSADATVTSAAIGRLVTGKLGDIAIYKKRAGSFFRSVVDAEPADVVMTMRGGKVLYGDASLVQPLDTTTMCETLTVCGTMKSVCVKGELTPLTGTNSGDTLALLQMANANTYPLFACGVPAGEPTCVPERAGAANVKQGSTQFTAMSMDTDKDGIPELSDNCPQIFNPIRPMDNMAQADADGDMQGDVCDVCPLDANTTMCSMFDPNDRDGDGVVNATDNCPVNSNVNQMDVDMDGKGDLCDSCPMQSNPGGSACPSNIYDIKTGVVAAGAKVGLPNVLVTGASARGYFLQVLDTETGFMGRDNSGIFVFQTNPGIAQGDRLSILSASVSPFRGQIQLSGAGSIDAGLTLLSSGNPLPAPVLVNPADLASNDGGLGTKFDGVLVRVENVVVTHTSPDAGTDDMAPTLEFEVTGGMRVNDYLYLVTPFPTLGQQFLSITGIAEFRNGQYKIEPRGAADFVYGPSSVSSLTPGTVFIREGESTTLPMPLTVTLTNPETIEAQVIVTSSGPEVLVADGGLITVPMNMTSSVIPLTGISSTDGGTVTISATKGTSTRTALVRVLGINEVSKLISLTPGSANISSGGSTNFTVNLDIPSATATVINLALTPATFGTIPATVSIPANAVSATFALTADAMAMGMGSVQATLGADSFTSMVTVTALPVTNHIVISEFASRSAASAYDEFAELYNPTSQAIDISGWRLQTKSATTTTWTDRVTFPGNTSLAPRRYWLTANTTGVAGIGYVSPASGPAPDSTWLGGSNGLGDTGAIRLVRTVNQMDEVIDAVAFGPTAVQGEGAPLAALPGTSMAAATFERKAKMGSTPMSMSAGGADALQGNAYDTDVNANDFILRPTRDAQSNQSPAEP